jgi:adenylyltransferase/sulfurtransferase
MSAIDLERYKCQLNLPEIGKSGQDKIANSSILCIGAGGLANSALPYLAAAGVGMITVVDGDTVSEANLHRQILFNDSDVGKNKAVIISDKLSSQNPNTSCVAVSEFLGFANAESLIAKHDLVLDCSDNYFTRYLISDTCFKFQKPDIFAAVIGFEGYITIFNGHNSPCYRCFHAEPPKLENVGNCSDLGVLGTVPGLFGLMQATEAIKYILNIATLQSKLFKMNFFDFTSSLRNIAISTTCQLCSRGKNLESIDRFTQYATHTLSKVLPFDLDKQMQDYFCIDVRGADEYKQFNLGFLNLPSSSFSMKNVEEAIRDKTQPLLICCAHGMRSRIIAAKLNENGYVASNLEGGIEAYRALKHD